jgi:hypothetical protein
MQSASRLHEPLPFMIPGPEGPILTRLIARRQKASLSSMDSDLEAFSRNPTDDSFAPMAVQPRANTNDPKQRFLSY